MNSEEEKYMLRCIQLAQNGLCNYDNVVEAEKELNNNALTKPHPYMFLKALYGTDYSNKRIVDGDYDKAKIKTTLVVGDEKLGANYILKSVEDFLVEGE